MSVSTRFAALALGAGLTLGSAFASSITITGVAGFPNGRTSNDTPINAIDGDINTYTWTTESFNGAAPSYLAISFDDTEVNHIRLWKTPDGGSGANIKDLVIQYTTDTGALNTRNYTTVTGLVNGFLGDELLDATSVNSDGTVVGDVHNSINDGWASLTFNTVHATGVVIAFTSPGGGFNHYRVGEFQAYDEDIISNSPEPGTILLFAGGLTAAGFARRRR